MSSEGMALCDQGYAARHYDKSRLTNFRISIKMTGTDLLVDAAFAGAKGYQEAKKHGVERGARVAATSFAKSQSIGSASDAIATVAVRSVPGLNAHPIARDVVRDAVSSSIDQAFEGKLGG
jgi:hypothetical protein